MPRKKIENQEEIDSYIKEYTGSPDDRFIELVSSDCKAWKNILGLIYKNTITIKFKFYKTMLIITGTRIVESSMTRARTKFHIEETIDAGVLSFYNFGTAPTNIALVPDEFELEIRSDTLDSVIKQLAGAHIFLIYVRYRSPTTLVFHVINLTTKGSSVNRIKAMEQDNDDLPDQGLSALLKRSKSGLISSLPMKFIVDMNSECFKMQISKLTRVTHSSFVIEPTQLVIKSTTSNMTDQIAFKDFSTDGLRSIDVLDSSIGTVMVQFDPCSLKKFLTGLRNIRVETSVLLKFGVGDPFILCYNIGSIAQVNVLVLRTLINER
jgi:hypothetical protein